jgi:hypothetical protein
MRPGWIELGNHQEADLELEKIAPGGGQVSSQRHHALQPACYGGQLEQAKEWMGKVFKLADSQLSNIS